MKDCFFFQAPVDLQFFSAFSEDFGQQHVAPVLIDEGRASAAGFCQHLQSQPGNAHHFQVHQAPCSQIKKGIPFRLQGKLVRYKQQGFAFYGIEYEFVFVDLFAAVIDMQH